MRPMFSISAALLLAGTMLSGAAWAQTAVTPRQQRAGLPEGPYLLSCTHSHMVNGRLVALCDNRANATEGRDAWHWSQLSNTEACTGAVENMNGQLTCAMAPMVGSSMPPQTYGSAYGTSGANDTAPGEITGAASGPYVPPYEAGTSGSPNNRPVPPQYYGSETGASHVRSQAYGSWQVPAYRPTNVPGPYNSSYANAQLKQPNPAYGSWQVPAYRPTNAPEPYGNPYANAQLKQPNPAYGSWQVPAYHSTAPTQ